MFIMIENYIINIGEIKLVEKKAALKDYSVIITFKDGQHIGISEKNDETAEAILNYIFSACQNFQKPLDK